MSCTCDSMYISGLFTTSTTMTNSTTTTPGFDTLALLVTGGGSDDGDGPHTAEVMLPTGHSCSLPDLPSPGRWGHTQNGLTACGGWGDGTGGNCLTFTDQEWEQSQVLTGQRQDHVSWQSPLGIFLLGGFSHSAQSSELLSNTTSISTAAFTLAYGLRYMLYSMLFMKVFSIAF